MISGYVVSGALYKNNPCSVERVSLIPIGEAFGGPGRSGEGDPQ